MLYQVRHKTRFRYAFPVSFARCNLRLQPVEWGGQTLEDYVLELSPAAHVTGTRPIGYLGNVTRMVMDRPSEPISGNWVPASPVVSDATEKYLVPFPAAGSTSSK